MKKFRDLSINVKMPLIVGITGLVVMAAVCTILIFSQRQEVYDNTTRAIRLSAGVAAAYLAEDVNSAAIIPRTFASIASAVIQSNDVPQEEKRARLLEELRLFVDAERRIDNIWAFFIPNAVDGLDDMFVGNAGSDANGVFMPWMLNRQLRTMSDDRTQRLFDAAIDAGYEVFTDPYLYNMNGNEEHVLSLCIPVIVGGQIVGVVGRDFLISHLNDVAVSFDNSGRGRLVSQEGIIIVHANPARIGAIVGDGHRGTLEGLRTGRDFDLMVNFQGNEEYQAFICVQFGECEKKWFYGVSIPASDIYTALRSTTIELIILAILGAFVIATIGLILIRWMLKDVKVLNITIDKLSLGQINQQIQQSKSSDEIGTMKNKLYQFVDSLKRTALFANNIGQGKLDEDYKLLSDDDVLGQSLLEMRKSLQIAESERAKRIMEEEQRNWGTEGLAKFAEILRQDNDNMEALSYNVISNIVKYMGANQGGMFILNEAENEADRVLELTACYAYDRKKFVEKKIRPGEGLIGSCFLEGMPVYMTNVPQNYVNITSGLGDSNPKAIYICPLKVNDVIYGVIEIAAFEEFEPYKRDFVNKVSESIASTIASVHVNLRTSQLLERTKLQAEEMANAEEELRQNMEEMQATQEEMRRRELELQDTVARMSEIQEITEENEFEMKQFQDAVFDTFSIYEFSPDGYITAINDSFLKLFDVDSSAFIGKHDSEFISKEEYDLAWKRIAERKIWDTVQKVDVRGKTIDLHQRYIPICNKQGELLRVLVFAFIENN